jgi:hypothetical protein
MKRLGIALAGLAVGAAIGWCIPYFVYPWKSFSIATAGDQSLEYAFERLGMIIGGALGFVAAGLAALRWVHVEYIPKTPPIIVDPRKVEDNL